MAALRLCRICLSRCAAAIWYYAFATFLQSLCIAALSEDFADAASHLPIYFEALHCMSTCIWAFLFVLLDALNATLFGSLFQ